MSEIVKVVWLDSTCFRGWYTEDQVSAGACVVATSWGQVIHENDERIVLAHQTAGDGDVYNATLIPHAQIISLDTYEVEE